MGKADVLDRVAVDLARGHTQPAIQRLSSLVTAHPTDLDLRRRLAAVHRMVGNRVEAGRWSYLQSDAAEVEVDAFERAYRSPTRRLAALRWSASTRLAATGYARQRLDDLAALASAERSTLLRAVVARSRWSPTGVALLMTALAGAVFVVIGAVTALEWVF
jgi:hypothetical protein